MLDTTLVRLLQEQASPALTEIMRVVSFWGYVPSCLAVAIVCGFGWRLRLGVTLILAVVFADALTMVAKGAFASPRPHTVDARVRTFGAFESELPPMARGTFVPADDFGFPSGHVATTTAWALGLAWSRRRRWQLGAAATWIALMALSRMYLGRHFPADVIGGVGVGIVGLAVARLELPPAAAGISTLTIGARTALGASLLVVVALAALFGAGLGAHDAGRFCGLVGAIIVLMRTRALDESVPLSTRMARIAVALVLFGVAVWSSTWTIATGPGVAMMSTMAISGALHASVLLMPLAITLRRTRVPSTRPIRAALVSLLVFGFAFDDNVAAADRPAMAAVNVGMQAGLTLARSVIQRKVRGGVLMGEGLLRRWTRIAVLAGLAALAGVPSSHGQQSGDAGPQERYVTVNGVRLYYADWGGEGDALLFLLLNGGNVGANSEPSHRGSRTASTSWG